MIIRCDECETRFRLDESRVPPTGARVRCSRCKHAFFVKPPGAQDAEAVHAVAAEAAATGVSSAPEPSWDLQAEAPRPPAGDTPGPISLGGTQAPSLEPPLGSEAEEESDWEFEDRLPDLGSAGGSSLSSAPGGADPNEHSFADLGDPESWDLASEEAPPLVPSPPAPADGATSAPAAAEDRWDPLGPEAAAALAAEAVEFTREATAEPAAGRSRAKRPMAEVLSWLTVLGLIALLGWQGLGTDSAPPRPVLAPVAGFEVETLRARLLENAFRGPILVVSGRLANPGPEARSLDALVVASLVGADGSPIEGQEAVAGPRLPLAELREAEPRQLAESQEGAARDLALLLMPPGRSLEVDAVFAELPSAPARVVLRARPVPKEPLGDAAPNPLPPIAPDQLAREVASGATPDPAGAASRDSR